MKASADTIRGTKEPIIISSKFNLYQRYTAWLDSLTDHRFMIMAATIIFQVCITVPASVWSMNAAVYFNDIQLFAIIAGSFGILVPNLAVLPLRIIIPVFTFFTLLQFIVSGANLITLI